MKNATVATTLMSLPVIESTSHSPMPCQPKIFSVKVAPTASVPNE